MEGSRGVGVCNCVIYSIMSTRYQCNTTRLLLDCCRLALGDHFKRLMSTYRRYTLLICSEFQEVKVISLTLPGFVQCISLILANSGWSF